MVVIASTCLSNRANEVVCKIVNLFRHIPLFNKGQFREAYELLVLDTVRHCADGSGIALQCIGNGTLLPPIRPVDHQATVIAISHLALSRFIPEFEEGCLRLGPSGEHSNRFAFHEN